jgi:hypothetical protein
MKLEYACDVNNGSGRSLKNCFRRPATLFTSWLKLSGLVKSTWDESAIKKMSSPPGDSLGALTIVE